MQLIKWKEIYLDSKIWFSLMRFIRSRRSTCPRGFPNVPWTQNTATITNKIFIFANCVCHWSLKSWMCGFYTVWNLFTQHLGNLLDSPKTKEKHVWRIASSHMNDKSSLVNFKFIYTICDVILSYSQKLGKSWFNINHTCFRNFSLNCRTQENICCGGCVTYICIFSV